MSKVTAVVVTYNRKELLIECINTLVNQSLKLEKIIIIDNNSNDGTTEYLKIYENNQQFNIIYLEENIGGAGGFNIGMKEAMKYNHDWIWLMDDDTIPHVDALENLIKHKYIIKNKDKIGYLSSNVYWSNGEAGLINVPEINNNGWNKYFDQGLVSLKTTTFVSFLVNQDVVRSVGYPIKEFFIWGDDTEYSKRIFDQGYECYLVADSKVVHKRGLPNGIDITTEANLNRLHMYRYASRNWTYLARQNGYKSLIVHNIRTFKLCLKILFRSDYKIKRLKYYISGWFKGLLFNPKIEK
ncbi:glycosyltransferase family 2 protein [Turicibacter sanguinis]|uniref:glycosyltransferase family 2 protein n=1 Tax=Turicibacter sanguinis TaxID=154288 RepID=UPI0018AC0DF6|nr:glycosyltransferase family 2 protein [Turicibacter sanguinis]MDB8558550.1 glycosyltransferase family 2 protein [Turicibacter sanguinis]MDB8561346.1 glycosyltransferase family 2 protein [Turicibacter sanguinis]